MSNNPDSIKKWMATKNLVLTDESGEDIVFPPIFDYNFMQLTDETRNKCFEKYYQPSSLQSLIIPIIKTGKNIASIYEKYDDFIIAVMEAVHKAGVRKQKEGPSVLLICPNRNTTQEVEKALTEWSPNVNSHAFYFQAPNQCRWLAENGVDVFVCMADRLNHLILQDKVQLEKLQLVIILNPLDMISEFDVWNHVRETMILIKQPIQTLVFSATWDGEHEALLGDVLQKPFSRVHFGSDPNTTKCAICLDPMELNTISSLPCGHVLHSKCAKQHIFEHNHTTCPICRKPALPVTRLFIGDKNMRVANLTPGPSHQKLDKKYKVKSVSSKRTDKQGRVWCRTSWHDTWEPEENLTSSIAMMAASEEYRQKEFERNVRNLKRLTNEERIEQIQQFAEKGAKNITNKDNMRNTKRKIRNKYFDALGMENPNKKKKEE